MTYNAENEVTAVSGTGIGESALYDGLGRRVQKSITGGSTYAYVYDAFGWAAEYVNGGWVKDYIRAGGGSLVATGNLAGPCATCYLTFDHLGSARAVTDGSANVVARHDYLPFGEEIAANTAGRNGNFGSTSDVTEKFTGQERDQELGMDYFNARNMTPALGRFNSADPGNAGADMMNPQSWNGYGYVWGQPLNNTDPSGRDCVTFDDGSTGDDGQGTPCPGSQTSQVDNVNDQNAGSVTVYATGLGVSTALSTPSVAESKTPAKNGLTSAQLQTILNAAKKDAAACAGTFSAGMSPFGLRFSLKGFDAQIQNTKYVQYPNPATSPLGPLSSVEAQALKGSIALCPNFFTDTSPRQAGIVVHENLHVYTGWSDSNVFSVFQPRGITPNDVTQFMKYGNTDGITTWILRGCK